jgi:hypothetical protein
MRILQDYAGRNVRLTAERLEHILGHAEMADQEAALEETLRRPQLVLQSTSDETATLNYRWYFGTKVGDKWLCVVVKYMGDDAFVLTAYLTDKPKKGQQLWPTT